MLFNLETGIRSPTFVQNKKCMYIKINQLQGASYVPLDTVKFFGEDFVLPDTTLLITDRGDIYRVPADTIELVRSTYQSSALTPER